VSLSSDDLSAHFLSKGDLTSIATGAETLFLGDANGNVRILSRAFKVIRSFRAADSAAASIVQLKQVPNTSLLISIAEDLSNDPVLKVWALDKSEKKTGGPRCLCTVGIQNGRRQFPV
jgi:vacuolar protein sorting-associated protein 11